MSDYEDVDYTVEGATAVITIDRPERYNAFRGRTVEELIRAFRSAWADRQVQAVVSTLHVKHATVVAYAADPGAHR